MTTRHPPLLDIVRGGAQVLDDGDRDYEALLSMVGERPFVLLGEASHGTHDFYAMRADITRRLIVEHGFDAVAVEADWPDARSGRDRFFLPLRGAMADALSVPLLERAIGVVYRPETELASHYFEASLGAQFDAVFHPDETTAVEPFDVTAHWRHHEVPETWPSGL